jgi:hypothetical protein
LCQTLPKLRLPASGGGIPRHRNHSRRCGSYPHRAPNGIRHAVLPTADGEWWRKRSVSNQRRQSLSINSGSDLFTPARARCGRRILHSGIGCMAAQWRIIRCQIELFGHQIALFIGQRWLRADLSRQAPWRWSRSCRSMRSRRSPLLRRPRHVENPPHEKYRAPTYFGLDPAAHHRVGSSLRVRSCSRS